MAFGDTLLEVVLRGAAHFFGDIILDRVLRGTGTFILRHTPFYVDSEGTLALVVGFAFWALVIGGVVVLVRAS